MFIEVSQPSPRLLLLGFLVVLLLMPLVLLRQVTPDEARVGLAAREMLKGQSTTINAPEQSFGYYPATPYVLTKLNKFLPLNAVVLRLPCLISLFALAFLCAWVTMSSGLGSGGVAAAVTLSLAGAIQWGTRGGGAMPATLLVTIAWTFWYVLGRLRRRWLYAWLGAYLAVFGAILANGAIALAWFFLPLFFLRRPLKVWRRLLHADHLISAGLVSGLAISWLTFYPGAWNLFFSVNTLNVGTGWGGYLWHLISFPFLASCLWFPWIFFGWPAFCAAFLPLERDPVLGQFLRTICVVLFLFFWLVPLGNGLGLLPLIGPLAVLTAQHYRILIRRHGKILQRLPIFLGLISVWGGGLLFVTVLIIRQMKGPLNQALTTSEIIVMTISLVAWTGGMAIRRWAGRLPIWQSVLAAMAVISLITGATSVLPAQIHPPGKKNQAIILTRNLDPTDCVYILSTTYQKSPVLVFYLQRPVQKIQRIENLPVEETVVSILHGMRAPVSPEREWKAISDPVEVNGQALRMWMGTKR